jgi:hypothetical protein
LPLGTNSAVYHSAEGFAPPELVVQYEAAADPGPTGQLEEVQPQLRVQDVDQVRVVFSEPISGFDLSDVQLVRNDGANRLPAAATLATDDGTTWTLGNLAPLTDQPGRYLLRILAENSGIVDAEDQPLVRDVETSWTDVREAGDANLDRRFDQLDIVHVLQRAKYLTGSAATWAEGDWNGDDVFNQLDIVAALQTGNYLQGPYAATETFDEVFRQWNAG